MNTPWRNKAHKIINSLCRQSYLKENQLNNGKLRKKHVPYSVPEEAKELIDCLNRNDEEKAKEMFLNNYRISKI